MARDKFDPDRLASRLEKLHKDAQRRRIKNIRAIGYPPRWLDEMFEQQAGKCCYCRRPMTRKKGKEGPASATFDHLTPISRGGATRRSNLKLACYSCNTAKGSMTEDEYIASRKPNEATPPPAPSA